MYISMNGTLTGGRRLEWTEFARLAAKAGFPGTDVLQGAVEAGADATRKLLAELKLRPAVIGLPVDFRRDEETFQAGLKTLDRTASVAVALGCPVTTWLLPSTELPKKEARALYKRRLSACADVLARSHVKFGFEYVSPVHLRKRFAHEFIWRMDEMLEFARECGPNAGVLLDSWHWHHAGATVNDILTAGRQGIIHVQAADAPDLPPEKIVDSERLMPGEGVIDFNGFFGALRKIGYNGGVSPEVFGRGLKDMPPEQGARLGLETTQAVMRKAGVL